MPVAEYFSRRLRLGERTLSGSRPPAAGAAAHQLPAGRPSTVPAGEALACDVARLGSAQAQSALLVIAGTHGVEGFAGSGCQVGLLEDRLHEALPPSDLPRAAARHSIPTASHGSGVSTRTGVDLNRNFVDFSRPLPSSAAYEALHDWLVPADWDGEARRAADAALVASRATARHAGAAGRHLRAASTRGPPGSSTGACASPGRRGMLVRVLAEVLPATVRRLGVSTCIRDSGRPLTASRYSTAADPPRASGRALVRRRRARTSPRASQCRRSWSAPWRAASSARGRRRS